MSTTSWGIIGPGKIARKFATALTMVEGARLAAIASRDAQRGRAFVAEHVLSAGGAVADIGVAPKAIRVYDRYDELAADASIDAVYIATPHGFHAEHALLCLRQGKAVLCEKPMALSARQVREMIAASREHSAFLMEAMWTRFIPLMKSVMVLVDSGAIGAVKYIRADFGFLAPFNPSGRLFDLRLGGGSLLDIGIYPLYLCTQLFGRPSSIVAAGVLSPTGSDETCHAILGYGDGRTAVISSTLACTTSLTAEIAGTAGMIRIPTPWYKNDRYEWCRSGEAFQPVVLEPMVNGFEYQAREVMECRSAGMIESPSLPHSFSLMMSEIMDAIRRQVGVSYPTE